MTKNQLDRATSLLDQYRAGTLPKTVSDSQLWQARKSAWQYVRLCRSRLCAASPGRTRSAGLTWCCARRLAVRDGVIHPDTGEVIPVPFRMSFFVFANVPICVGMLLTAPTVRGRLWASAASCDHGVTAPCQCQCQCDTWPSHRRCAPRWCPRAATSSGRQPAVLAVGQPVVQRGVQLWQPQCHPRDERQVTLGYGSC